MITRKLAVPLINEKILAQAEHCYIATAGISESGFEFIRSRLPPKCKVDLVTGLDQPASPLVLRKIMRHYQERIAVKIYSRSPLNANVFVFDLPFRKAVAYIGSGSLTVEGLKDQEELFWKVTDPKEIESLLSWFTSFYEFGIPLNEAIINEYEPVFRRIQLRAVQTRKEKYFSVAASLVDWESIRFTKQFFKRDDYMSLVGEKKIPNENIAVLGKRLSDKVAINGLFPVGDAMLAGLSDDSEMSIPCNAIAFSGDKTGFQPGLAIIQVGITRAYAFVRLRISVGDGESLTQLRTATFESVSKMFPTVAGLGAGYHVEVEGRWRSTEAFSNERSWQDWLHYDSEMTFPIYVERRFAPSDVRMSIDRIDAAFLEEIIRLNALRKQINP